MNSDHFGAELEGFTSLDIHDNLVLLSFVFFDQFHDKGADKGISQGRIHEPSEGMKQWLPPSHHGRSCGPSSGLLVGFSSVKTEKASSC